MGQLASLESGPAPQPRGAGRFAYSSLTWVAGAFATAAAVALAAVLTVVFAATLAVMAVLTSALVGLCALAVRARRGRARDDGLIEARRVGHTWVAYGWDRRSR